MSSIDFPQAAAPEIAAGGHVPESRFGVWFLGTETWQVHVLARAFADLERLIKARRAAYPVVLDAGCGWGHAFPLLRAAFRPERIVAVDIDPALLGAARRRAGSDVELHAASLSRLPLADASVDLVFCHQTLHHLVDQRGALAEFRRVLKPGGLLLVAESTRAFIRSWIIRLLSRHPMEVQRSASEYVGLLREAGFGVDADAVSHPYLWWSRPDLGLRQYLVGAPPSAAREETLVNAVAVRL